MDHRTVHAGLRTPTTPEGPRGVPRLSALVRIDLDGRHVALVVTGVLTGTNQQAPVPPATRTRALSPESDLTVEPHQAHEAEPAAVDLLRWSLEDARPVTGPVRIIARARIEKPRAGHTQ